MAKNLRKGFLKTLALTALSFVLAASYSTSRATVLGPGDVAFSAINTDGGDNFSIVLLTPISGTTTLGFTDNGWNGGGWGSTEGYFTWTYTGNLACGTEITFSNTTSAGTIVTNFGSLSGYTNVFSLSALADAILVYNGTNASPSFVAGINTQIGGVWSFDPANATLTSALPFPLVNGSTAMVTSAHFDDWKYNCSVTSGSGLLAALNTASNWIAAPDDNTPWAVPLGCFTAGCAPPPTATITSSTNVSCNGGSNGSATVSASGGTPPYTYSWSPNGGTNATATGRAAGNYTVTVIDAASATATATVTITQPSAMSISTAQANVSCFGGSNGAAAVSVSGATPPYTYSWSPSGGTNATASGRPAGSYTVTITDANSCTATRTFAITQPSSPVSGSTVVTNVACFGGSNGTIDLTPAGGTPGYTYNWGGGITTQDRTGLTAGTYTVSITDNNGCPATVTAAVSQPTSPVSGTTVVTNVACFGGSNGAINLTPSGGTGPYTYNWLPSGPTTEDRTGLVAGTYTVVITDQNSCTGTVTVSVTQPTSPVSGTTVVTNVACFGGSNGSINLTPSGGTGPYTYNWLPSGPTTEDRTGLVAGTYTVVITDNNACTGTVTVSVTQPTSPVSGTTVVTNVACFGGSNGAINLTPNGGTGPYTYNWGGGVTTEDRTGRTAGTYTVIITDNNSCTGTVTVSVSQPTSPVSGTTVVTNVACFGGSNGAINLTPSGGTGPGTYTYNWGGGVTTEDRTSRTAGTYTVIITDANACTGTVTVAISQPTSPVSGSTVVTNVACNGGNNGTINLTPSGGTGPYTFNWGGAVTTEDRIGLAGGTYTVIITDNNGCTATVTAAVTQPSISSTTWVGSTTAWNNAANWTCGVPTATTDAVINGSGITNMPIITSLANSRNITLSNNATLNVGSGGSLVLYGAISGSGFTAGNGDLTFAGSTAQTSPGFSGTNLTIVNSAGVTFTGPVNLTGNFVMNGAGGLTTTEPINVGGMLTMTSGVINLGNGNLYAASASGGNATSYVKTNGTGALRMPVGTAGAVSFPVGRTAYNPATLNNTGTADSFSVRVFTGVTADGTEGGTPIAQSAYTHVNTTWLIDDIADAGANVAMTLQFNNGQQNNTYFDMNHTALAHYNSALPGWENFLAPTPNQAVDTLSAGVYAVTSSGITNFSPFTITSMDKAGSQPLPVVLRTFTATNEGSINKVMWTVEEEKNMSHFEVERSADANRFQPIQKVAASGLSGYSVYDRNPVSGLNYYRLKMVQPDGSYAYSSVARAFVNGSTSFGLTAYPNPVSNMLNIEAAGATNNAAVTLTSMNGKVIMQHGLINGKASLNIERLPAGLYIVRFEDGPRQETIKITKE